MGSWPGAGRIAGALLAASGLALSVPAPTAGAPASTAHGRAPFGLVCHQTEGVRYCPGDVRHRVPSFDGTPLDVNVVLPEHRPSAGFPLVIELHGWAGQKLALNDNAGGFQDPSGGQYGFLPTPRQLARGGAAVLTYSSRGFGNSCGTPASRDTGACTKGWTHLADVRYEVRDSQYLAGLLADQGIVNPRKVGVIGSSYGGLQALEMATLGDRSVLPDGHYTAWRSPGRRLRMHLAAAAALDTASSLVDALVPNGRFLDHGPRAHASDLRPIGVAKASWNLGLYGAGQAAGYLAPPGVDPTADLTTEFARLAAGDPYDDRVVAASLREVARFHEALHLRPRAVPPPTLLAYGWTDSLFPVDQALRWLARERRAHRHAHLTTAELLTDIGHPPSPNKPEDRTRAERDVINWMRHYLVGRRHVRVVRGYQARLHTCPDTAPSVGRRHAATWAGLHPSTASYRTAGGTVSSTANDPAVAGKIDPVLGSGICTQVALHQQQGTVLRRFPVPRQGLTVLGSPRITAPLAVSGSAGSAFLAARLWDEAPNGRARLVTRLLYRPRKGRQSFELHPTGYRFAPRHRIVLQILGDDAPYARPSNLPFTIKVARMTVRLPLARSRHG